MSLICPRRTVGDPAVTDLRYIRHTPDKTISFKLNHTNEPYTFLKLKPIQLGWNKGTTTAVLQLSENQEGEIAAPPFSESRDPSGLSSSLWQFVNQVNKFQSHVLCDLKGTDRMSAHVRHE